MPEGGVRWNNSPAVLPPHTGPSGALLTPNPAALLGFLIMGGRGGELPVALCRVCYQGAGPQRPVCRASTESHMSGWASHRWLSRRMQTQAPGESTWLLLRGKAHPGMPAQASPPPLACPQWGKEAVGILGPVHLS